MSGGRLDHPLNGCVFRATSYTASFPRLAALRSLRPDGYRTERSVIRHYFFARWVRSEWGQQGLRFLSREGGARPVIDRAGGLDQAQLAFGPALLAALVGAS